MSLESDYTALGRELLADHLRSEGLDSTVTDKGVRLGFGGLTADVLVESIKPSGDVIHVTYWAYISSYKGIEPPRIDLDLTGIGKDAREALTDAIHVLTDQVIPVLRADLDRSIELDGVVFATASSVTDGRPTAWDLVMGPAGVGGGSVDEARKAIGDLVLMQGLIDSLVDSMSDVRPHWYKLILVRGRDGAISGNIRIDGALFELAPSFGSATWPDVAVVVRQFGLLKPANRAIDEEQRDQLRAAGGEVPRRSWRERVFGR
jgi:hypothetical protein